MNTEQHTPGPWMILPNHERRQFVILTEYGTRIDVAETYGGPNSPREANANLIAAAPELLQEAEANSGILQTLLVHLVPHVSLEVSDDICARIDATNTAIAKARGQK